MDAGEIEYALMNLHDVDARRRVLQWASWSDPFYVAAHRTLDTGLSRVDRLEILLVAMICAKEQSRQAHLEVMQSLRPPDFIADGKRYQFVPPKG